MVKQPLPQPPAPAVGVVTAVQKPVQITRNLPGRLSASRSATVRARVTGIVQQRLFKEGSFVKRGQPLFQIDNRPFLAALQAAKAQLAQAQAEQVLNRSDVKRYSALLKEKAISRQVYEQAVARQEAAKAAVDMAHAAVTQAQLNLDYARVTAPISGYIGRAEVTEGALVSAASATQMAQIQQIDPLYINIRQSAGEMMKMRRIVLAQLDTPPRSSEEFLSERQVMVDVFLDDGTPYPMQGKLLFADVHVDESMGETSLRATLPNPQRLLMPGLYVRVEVPQMRLPDAVLLPQQAVSRGQKDTVLVVNKDNSFAPRTVTVVQSQGNNWVISDGLEAGEQVIVDGIMHLRGASVVKPVPWQGVQQTAVQKTQQQQQQQVGNASRVSPEKE